MATRLGFSQNPSSKYFVAAGHSKRGNATIICSPTYPPTMTPVSCALSLFMSAAFGVCALLWVRVITQTRKVSHQRAGKHIERWKERRRWDGKTSYYIQAVGAPQRFLSAPQHLRQHTEEVVSVKAHKRHPPLPASYGDATWTWCHSPCKWIQSNRRPVLCSVV